jgi:tyrosine aminotransferase
MFSLYYTTLFEIREGINRLSTLLLGANTVIQAALPEILHHTPPIHYETLIQTLHTHASFLFERLKCIRGLHPVRPQGAMYMMVKVNKNNSFPLLDVTVYLIFHLS